MVENGKLCIKAFFPLQIYNKLWTLKSLRSEKDPTSPFYPILIKKSKQNKVTL